MLFVYKLLLKNKTGMKKKFLSIYRYAEHSAYVRESHNISNINRAMNVNNTTIRMIQRRVVLLAW
jgi:hypothetical protein